MKLLDKLSFPTGARLLLLLSARSSPGAADRKDDAWPWPLQPVDSCDSCGSTSLSEVVQTTAKSCRTVLCDSCGLLFASPIIHPESLDRFFADGFEGDPGAQARVSRNHALERKALREEQSARDWALPVIARHIDLRGKTVLDIRSRSGTLARAMMEQGADVIGLDPLEPNVEHARNVNGLDNVRFMPISELGELRDIPDASVDAVTAMTVHILSHLPSPRRFVSRVFAVLRPGGTVFIDEKHALMPAKTARAALFGARPIHLFHFTEDSLGRYFRSVGFEVVECGIDGSKSTAFQHLRLVARKPAGSQTTPWTPHDLPPARRQEILQAIADAQGHLDRERTRHATRRRAKRILRRIGI